MINPPSTRHPLIVHVGELAPDGFVEDDAEPRPVADRSTRPADQSARTARFTAMTDSHFAFIWRALRGLGVPHASADDAAQQVFLVALQKLDEIAPMSERSFLFSTAIGVAANARRALGRSREIPDEEAVARSIDGRPDPEQASRHRQERAVLDAILGAMPVELCAVFVLFELEELTMAAIAELLSVPPGTVASRLRRAREHFHEAAQRAQAHEARGPKGGRR